MGNSLALAPDVATVERAIRQMLAAVRDGGAIVVQVLNLWRLPDGPCVWQKCKRIGDCPNFRLSESGTVPLEVASPTNSLILKGVHRCGDRGYVEMIVTDPSGDAAMRSESTPFLGLEAADLDCMARNAGAKKVAIFGGYKASPTTANRAWIW